MKKLNICSCLLSLLVVLLCGLVFQSCATLTAKRGLREEAREQFQSQTQFIPQVGTLSADIFKRKIRPSLRPYRDKSLDIFWLQMDFLTEESKYWQMKQFQYMYDKLSLCLPDMSKIIKPVKVDIPQVKPIEIDTSRLIQTQIPQMPQIQMPQPIQIQQPQIQMPQIQYQQYQRYQQYQYQPMQFPR